MNPADSSDQKPGLMLSLREILGESYDDFIDNFVRKPIKEAAINGKIDIYTLRSINKALKKKGTNIFDAPIIKRTYATKNTVEGGELFEVKLPIPNYSTTSLFVKIFPDKLSFERELNTQMAVQQLLVDEVPGAQELRKLIAPMSYDNEKAGLIAYPLINADSLAEKRLFLMDAEQKETLLKKAIDAHQRFSLILSNHIPYFDGKLITSSAFNELMDAETSFDKLFFSRMDRFGGAKPENEKTRSEIKASLDNIISTEFKALHSSHRYLIHLDLNPGNTLIGQDEVKIIDYEQLSLGFQEFAYGTLLTKASVDDDLEEKLVRWAAQNLAKLQNRDASEDEINSSIKRYELNRISQELFTAARYLKRAGEQENGVKSNTMRIMADVSYTLAIGRMKRAEAKGMLNGEFRALIERYNSQLFQDGLKEISQDQVHLMRQYNPHLRGSQENMASAHTLDFMATDVPQGEIVKELKQFDKYMSRGRKKSSWIKRAAYVAVPLVLVASIGLFVQQQTVKRQEASIANLVTEKKINGDIAIYNLLRPKSLDTREVLAQQYLDCCEKSFPDVRTGRLFFLNPKMAYEAMVKTGSKDYEKLAKYIEKNDLGLFLTIDDTIRGKGYADNLVYHMVEENARSNFERHMAEAKQSYEARLRKD